MTNTTIASTIYGQIHALDGMAWYAWGSKNPVALEDGLQFDVNGLVFKGKVIIKLNGADLYDITFGRVNRKSFELEVQKCIAFGLVDPNPSNFDVKETAEGVYCDQLVEILDHYIEGK